MIEPAIACLDQVWSSIEDVCSTLTTEEWKRPTDCPGWTVQDCVAHLSGIESRLLGYEQPPPIGKPWPDHVRNDLAALNEGQIELRRPMPPEDVLSEFLELTAQRLKVLAEATPEQLAAEGDGVLGRAPLRDVLAIRVVDCLYHEQDIRRAVARPGGLDGDPARFVYERMRAALPMVAVKRAGAPDGATVVVEVAGFPTSAIGVDAGRGSFLEQAPSRPTARIATDVETFLCLMGGRWTPARAAGRLAVEGDATLAGALVDRMNILF